MLFLDQDVTGSASLPGITIKQSLGLTLDDFGGVPASSPLPSVPLGFPRVLSCCQCQVGLVGAITSDMSPSPGVGGRKCLPKPSTTGGCKAGMSG